MGSHEKVPKSSYLILILILLFSVCGTANAINTGSTVSSIAPNQEKLPVVGTYEKLKSLLEESNGTPNIRYRDELMMRTAAPQAMMDSGASMNGMAMAQSKEEYSADSSYSQTNTQVQGVDEADLVKTDGSYIYKVSSDRVSIIKALPADKMNVVETLRFNDERYVPQELYLDDKHLIVIGTSSFQYPVPMAKTLPDKMSMPYRPHYDFGTTKAIIYDINNKNKIVKSREIELEGRYLSSRKIGSSFYLLTNKNIDYYALEQGTGLAPSYRDSKKGSAFTEQSMQEICYFPGHVAPNFLVIASLNLDKENEAAQVQSYLGGGQNVYASTENLYVSLTSFDYPAVEVMKKMAPEPAREDTHIYRFALEQGKVSYSGQGSVPGRILNQFAMDEHQGYFRIATTSGDMWRNDEYTSKNNVYVLNSEMKITGRLEGIAPGERIYSTRFMGDRAYMVTFKDVDPFFVLDLKDPQKPAILGKLKIPGYSDYLHPYDENHVIGFGKETIEMKGWNGDNQAFYQGMKVAIFDVSDLAHPTQMSKTTIGDRGTDSDLLHDHKALLFSKEKNLLAFPVNVMELQNHVPRKDNNVSSPEYGSFSFQGAYIYKIDLKKGLQLKGRITHLSSEDYLKAGDYGYGSEKNIQRVLFIGDTLYTVSDRLIKANRLSDLKELSSLSING